MYYIIKIKKIKLEKNNEEAKNNEDNNEVILINGDIKNDEGKTNEHLINESAVN